MQRRILACAMMLLAASPALARENKTITTLGTGVAIAVPVIAGFITVEKHDWKGTAQLGVETILTVGTALALKEIVRERRPDGSDFQSFPSDTTAQSASGSSFLWARYGWRYGLPAFATLLNAAHRKMRGVLRCCGHLPFYALRAKGRTGQALTNYRRVARTRCRAWPAGWC